MDILANQTALLNIIFLFLAILGLVATFVAYVKAKRIKRCNYNLRNFDIIGDKVSSMEDLSVQFKGGSINKFSSCIIGIWNSGNEVINKTDYALKDYLRIAFSKEENILEYKIVFVKTEANSFEIIQKENILDIDFDFMAPNDGIVIQIYHTEANEELIKVAGLIKGGESPYLYDPENEDHQEKSWDIMFGWLIRLINKLKLKPKLSYVVSAIVIGPLAILLSPVTLLFVIIGFIKKFLNPFPKEYYLENLNNLGNSK